MSNEHKLKTWPKHFDAIVLGRKRFELRRNDRDFHVDDPLRLEEWNPETSDYTGRVAHATVEYILRHGEGEPAEPPEGFVIMSIRPWLTAMRGVSR